MHPDNCKGWFPVEPQRNGEMIVNGFTVYTHLAPNCEHISFIPAFYGLTFQTHNLEDVATAAWETIRIKLLEMFECWCKDPEFAEDFDGAQRFINAYVERMFVRKEGLERCVRAFVVAYHQRHMLVDHLELAEELAVGACV